MPRLELLNLNKMDPDSTYLTKSLRKVHSQCGEEGILEKIFEILGHEHNEKWCVEFGAWDGMHLSNTCLFIQEKQWYGVQIEANNSKFDKLVKNFSNYPNAIQVKGLVGYTQGADSIEDFLATTPIPKNFDFISIDIDGNDWHIWQSMSKYRPRVVVIEFNPKIPNDVLFVQDRDPTVSQGCSLSALIELGKEKGYELICVHKWNAFFCLAEDYLKFSIKDNSIDAMFLSPGGRIFGCYDGTIYNTLGQQAWRLRGIKITSDSFQLLPKEQRVYGDAQLPNNTSSTPNLSQCQIEKSPPISIIEIDKTERKLHIGGTKQKKGWEIFNIVNDAYVDHIGNAKNMSLFGDKTFNVIYASHILEHFDYMEELPLVLKEWNRILKPHGKLYISVPDLDVLASLIQDKSYEFMDIFKTMRMIFGGQNNPYDFHKVGFNEQILQWYLERNGFHSITRVEKFDFFSDSSAKKHLRKSISLNIIATK